MLDLHNNTPFDVASAQPMTGASGGEVLVVLVKATFGWDQRGVLALAEEQVPLTFADEYSGKAGASTLLYASDLVPQKLGADIALLGHAYAYGDNISSTEVMLQVGATRQVVKVFGDRTWQQDVSGVVPGDPARFDRVPLSYQLAFGGTAPDSEEVDPRNPIGVGFCPGPARHLVGQPVPNLEDPAALLGSPRAAPFPAGFGFIPPHWESRRQWAGTYDQAWEETRRPLLPEDFHARFWNAAHPNLISPEPLQGGEDVHLVGLHPRIPSLRIKLPRATLSARLLTGRKEVDLPLACDTLVLEPDRDQLTLVWRGVHPCPGGPLSVRRITLEVAGA